MSNTLKWYCDNCGKWIPINEALYHKRKCIPI